MNKSKVALCCEMGLRVFLMGTEKGRNIGHKSVRIYKLLSYPKYVCLSKLIRLSMFKRDKKKKITFKGKGNLIVNVSEPQNGIRF